MNREPFGIYVHWPFCAAKCPYCDFNSHVRNEIDEARWAKAVARELRYFAELQGPGRSQVETVFFGGGTPSLMRGTSVAQVLETVAQLWPVSADVEVTLESNPASADAARFRDYRAAGVNRLSLGVQALEDSALKQLGRLHDVAEAKAALALAMKTFERVSLDLIYARPNQTAEQWRAELREALGLGTEHLSLYQLTIEPNTPFAILAGKGELVVPAEPAAVELYEITQELTQAAGVPAYEVSNHARPGAECRHNLLYWRYGDYAGVGPGAHSRLTMNGERLAFSTERLPERWQRSVETQGHGVAEQLEIPNRDAAGEHLLMNLRLAEGMELAPYEQRWGVVLNRNGLATLKEQQLLEADSERLRATPQGRLVLNSLIAAIAP